MNKKYYPLTINLHGTRHAYGSLIEEKKTVEYVMSLLLSVKPLGSGKTRKYATLRVTKNGQPLPWCAEKYVTALGEDAYAHDNYLIDGVQPDDVYAITVLGYDGEVFEELTINVYGATLSTGMHASMLIDAADQGHITRAVRVIPSAQRPARLHVAA